MTVSYPKAGVIGWPISHSRSPLIHTHWLKTYNIGGTYEAIAVDPEDAEDFFGNFKTSTLSGVNITIPHKESVLPFLDEIAESAKVIGAVNTIWIEDGKLCGTNTDWIGFLKNLDQLSPAWDENRKTALVLGAGGAARGILFGLLERGFEKIIVANRTVARAEEMQRTFGPAITPVSLDEAEGFLSDIDLLVNTTSLGMKDNPPLPLSLETAPSHCLVTDIVYTPLETPILAEAKARGLQNIDGLGMLLHQAAPGFEKWFGIMPEVTSELRDLILKDMGLLP